MGTQLFLLRGDQGGLQGRPGVADFLFGGKAGVLAKEQGMWGVMLID